MEDNLYTPLELALMSHYEEKEANANEEYNKILYCHNPDQKVEPIIEKCKRKIGKEKFLKNKKRKK